MGQFPVLDGLPLHLLEDGSDSVQEVIGLLFVPLLSELLLPACNLVVLRNDSLRQALVEVSLCQVSVHLFHVVEHAPLCPVFVEEHVEGVLAVHIVRLLLRFARCRISQFEHLLLGLDLYAICLDVDHALVLLV